MMYTMVHRLLFLAFTTCTMIGTMHAAPPEPFKPGTSFGSANCPVGYQVVTDQKKCLGEAAKFFKKPVHASGCWAFKVRGCVYKKDGIYFNTCAKPPTGAKHKALCEPASKEFEHEGVSYRLVTEEKTWEDAEKNCVALDGHLATISLLALNTAIQNKLKVFDVASAWHGYNDKSTDGTWEWANPSGRCKTYKHWKDGEPNGSTDENCGELGKDHGKWNDVGCSAKKSSICEVGAKAKEICGGPTTTTAPTTTVAASTTTTAQPTTTTPAATTTTTQPTTTAGTTTTMAPTTTAAASTTTTAPPTTTTPAATTTTTQPTTTTGPVCEDKSPLCSILRPFCTTGIVKEKAICDKTCGFCGQTTTRAAPTITPEPACKDRDPGCADLKGFCKTAESFLRDLAICDKTCGFCEAVCEDRSPACKDIKPYCKTPALREFLREKAICDKTCEFCGISPSSITTTIEMTTGGQTATVAATTKKPTTPKPAATTTKPTVRQTTTRRKYTTIAKYTTKAKNPTTAIVITTKDLPVNGGWSAWGPYTACQPMYPQTRISPCMGLQASARMCDNPTPSNGGLPCPGPLYKYRTCPLPCTNDFV